MGGRSRQRMTSYRDASGPVRNDLSAARVPAHGSEETGR